MYPFKDLLCSIVNQMLAHVIRKSFSFNFIYILKNIPTFPEFELYRLINIIRNYIEFFVL